MSDFFSKLFAFKFAWFGKLIHDAHKPFLQLAIDTTNTLKTGLNSGLLDLAVSLTPTDVDNEVLAALRKEIPVILADEMLVQSTGYPATEQAAQDLAKKLVDSFGLMKDEKKEELYTSVAAQVYIFLQSHAHGEKVTFGQAASLAESFYEDWKANQS
jgi:hypothetical protein